MGRGTGAPAQPRGLAVGGLEGLCLEEAPLVEGVAAVLGSPVAAVLVGTAVALIALAHRALRRASDKLDRIMAEELDR